MSYRIGEVAAAIGVETHVLRHWEDVGVLIPGRSATGQRVYDHEAVTRGRIIRRCQRAGLSLAQIRALAPAGTAERAAMIDAQRAAVQEAIVLLRRTDAYLDHLTQCRHPLADECAECSAFAHDAALETSSVAENGPGSRGVAAASPEQHRELQAQQSGA